MQRLASVKTAGANKRFKLGELGGCHRLGIRIDAEQLTAGEIDARIGALRRKPPHDEKPPGVNAAPLERTFGRRIELL